MRTSLFLALLALLSLPGCEGGPLVDDDDAANDDDVASDDDDAANDDDVANDDDSVDPEACGEAVDWTEDWQALTDGVSTIESGGSQPDNLLLHGPGTFPVVQDESGRPFVAAGHLGDGRAVAFAHESYLGGSMAGSDVGQLVDNAVRWAADSEAPVVAVAPNTFSELVSRLQGDGLTVQEVAPSDLDDTIDVYVYSAYNGPDQDDLLAVRAYLEGGGGLLLGGQAWWYTYSTGEPASTFAGNIMVGDLGIWFAGEGAISAGTDSVASAPPSPLEQGHSALAALLAHLTGGPTLTQGELSTAVTAAGGGVSSLPIDTDFFSCARAVANAVGPVVITESAPLVRADSPLQELVVRLDVRQGNDLPASELWAHDSASDFPGAVPGDADRDTVSVEIDGTHAGIDSNLIYSGAGAWAWRGTGVYAAPGEVLTVEVSAAHAGQGLEIQVGAHADGLWGKDSWDRPPQIVRRDALSTTSTDTGNLWGGPVYVRVPTGSALGPVSVSITGGVRAPRFVRGETTNSEWTAGLRDLPGPWAELEADHFIITVPSAAVRTLDDPEALMAFWDAVLDADADVYGIDHDRPRAERFVLDRQISAGWMHSGYPIMAHLASTDEVLNLTSLQTAGAWGPFHELGHNHQHRDFVLPGTTEGNVNLFSVYASELVAGVSRDVAHPAIAPTDRAQRVADYVAGGADFSQWSVWTALETYLQLQEGFGWEPYPQLFQLYRGLDATNGHPGDDQGRIDLFVQSFSDLTERDLGPFFTAWGFPVSQSVLDDIAQWPVWSDDPMNP